MIESFVIAQTQQLEAGVVAFVVGLFLAAFLIVLLANFAINIVICALLHTSVGRVPQQYRVIEPGLVWLLLIPLFQVIWNFFVHVRVSRSFQNYFQATGDTTVGDCGESIGRWYAICVACTFVPCANYIAGPAALVLLIIFLVKVWDLRSRIGTTAPPAM